MWHKHGLRSGHAGFVYSSKRSYLFVLEQGEAGNCSLMNVMLNRIVSCAC